MRMRPTWEVTSWSDWKKCSRDSYDDYTKTPKLHDWEYEVRRLYTTPPYRKWVGFTTEEILGLQDFAYADDFEFVNHIEALLKEKNT